MSIWCKTTLKDLSKKKIERILVRSTNWIGDAVMTTPALKAVRETFPEAHITVVANPLVAQLFDCHPDRDEVLVFDKKDKDAGLLGFVRFALSLRNKKFDCAFLFQNAVEAAFMANIAGVKKRVGYTTDGRRLLLSHPVPISEAIKALHHTDYYLEMLSHYGVRTEGKQQRLALRSEEVEWAANKLKQVRYAVINPGAAYGSAKRWIPERFAVVADELVRRYDLGVVLTGGPAEVEIGNDISRAMQEPHQNLIGKTKVRELMAILSGCSLMVTNDSGPMHVAAAFDVPIVAIFGPTDHTTTSPWGNRTRVVRHQVECSPCLLRQCPIDHRCMQRVSANDVLLAVESLVGAQK